MKETTKRLSIWAVFIALLLLIPLIMTLRGSGADGDGWHWTLFDFVLMGSAAAGIGLIYELIARRSKATMYRAAFAAGLVGLFLLFWINGAVGIIGNENNPANLMYGAVFAVVLIGALISRFTPRGMSYTLFMAAFIQLLVPIFALLIWPAETKWAEPGVIGVLILNLIFVSLFSGSALLFWRSVPLAQAS